VIAFVLLDGSDWKFLVKLAAEVAHSCIDVTHNTFMDHMFSFVLIDDSN